MTKKMPLPIHIPAHCVNMNEYTVMLKQAYGSRKKGRLGKEVIALNFVPMVLSKTRKHSQPG